MPTQAVSFDDLITKLESFKDLQIGWNGYAADPPSEDALRIARKFLGVARQCHLLPTRLAPSAVGGVGITFRRPNTPCHVYVEFYNDGRAFALFSDDITDPLSLRFGPTRIAFFSVMARIEEYLTLPSAPHFSSPVPSPASPSASSSSPP